MYHYVDHFQTGPGPNQNLLQAVADTSEAGEHTDQDLHDSDWSEYMSLVDVPTATTAKFMFSPSHHHLEPSAYTTLAELKKMGSETALLKILQAECSVIGSSFTFAGSNRVTVKPSGHQLFAKLTTPAEQVLGEGESLKAMRAAFLTSGQTGTESLVPHVHACGEEADGRRAYLVTDWLELSPRIDRGAQRLLGKRLAYMHKNGTNKEGKFGFHVPTHCGATKQDNTWTASWTEFWGNRRIGDLVRRISASRKDSELEQLEEQLRTKYVASTFLDGQQAEELQTHERFSSSRVYPILLEPLEGKITPAILHGDLWSGNAGQDDATGSPMIFDSSYYGHNEAELGMMHMFGGFTADFFDAYHKVLPKFEPHYDQRIQLYELYHHLNHALMFGGSYRGGAISMMRSLVQYADRSAKAGL
ncbi:hypothetical protein BCV70DRAFT_233135 [Testicularia cyperi]|uniref:protein-ribulosamine 3-kinase n=1 Tax=Testicularia cyperi TaxID=1882483 RepID=A0A317XLB3_9BASI|nr:hypothetical protein BCV70DRAFT_233135 [Testicularia cyperi]